MLNISRVFPSNLPRLQTVCACSMSSSKEKPDPPPYKPKGPIDEAGKLPKLPDTKLFQDLIPPQSDSPDERQYKTPWHQEEGRYFSLLRGMYSPDSNRNMLQFLQTPIDFSPTAIKAWWKKKQKMREIILQSYLPERNRILGNDLAAAHFVVYRGGAVKFYGENRWIKKDEFGNYSLPPHFDGSKVLEAIDCQNMTLYYEGLVNFRDLRQVKWLSVNGCENVDDWCLDRISNIFRHDLVYLDLRNCSNYTHRGLGALYKMKDLKILYVDDILLNSSFELTCLMLQQVNPHLEIRDDE